MGDVKKGSAERVPELYTNAALDENAVVVMAAPGNLYGFLAQNNSGASAVYLQFFDSATAVGFTPQWTIMVPAGGVLGKDAVSFALKHFASGMVVRAASTRDGAVAPAAGMTVDLWYQLF